MPQAIKIPSPLKGVNRAFAREQQPEMTCFDALNVLPFDRFGRMRIAQRGGIAILDNLPADMRLLHTASYAAGAGAVFFDDTFQYSNGSLTGQGGWIAHGVNVPLNVVSDMAASTNTAGEGTSINVSGLAGWTQFNSDFDWTIKFTLTTGASDTLKDLNFWLQKSTSEYIWYEMSIHETSTGHIQFASVSVPGSGAFDLTSYTCSRDTEHTIVMSMRRQPDDGMGNIAKMSISLDGTHLPLLDVAFSDLVTDPALKLYMFGYNGSTGTTHGTVKISEVKIASPAVTRTALTLVAASGADTYIGDPTSLTLIGNSSSFPLNASAPYISAATLFDYTYIVDGGTIRRLDLNAMQFVAFAESGGTAPTGCTIACNWRGRLILSGDASDPQNFFASKAGDPLNWDNGDGTPVSAFAGNASKSGLIGQPIQALIPMSDDILIIGCDQSMWAVRGDPADGGAITLITDFAGIVGATAWTRTPDGSLYFVGPRGFFKMSPDARNVQEISQATYPQYFQDLDRSTSTINLVYDVDRFGIWIMVSPTKYTGVAATSLFYDRRMESPEGMGGMWPIRFTNLPAAGPLSAVWWDGFGSDNRYMVIGGFGGDVFQMTKFIGTDSGSTIDSYIVIGPVHPAEADAMLTGTTFNFGELSPTDSVTPALFNGEITLRSGKTAFDVTEGTPINLATATMTRDRRSRTLRQRLRGEWFAVKISNTVSGKYFTLEDATLEFEGKGRNRRQR